MRLTNLLLLFALLLQLGCTGKEKLDPEVIRVSLESAPKTLDPRRATDANGQRIANLIFQSFVRLGPDMKIIGEAAKTWELKADRLSMKLVDNLKFSDGAELTAEDIYFTFDEYTKKSSIFASAYKQINKVKVSGTNTTGFDVLVELNESSATLLTDMSPLKILPKKIVEKLGPDFGKNLVGSGTYMLTSNTSSRLLLEPNPHSIRQISNKGIEFKIIKDDNTRYLKVLKGDIDLAPNVLSPQSNKKMLDNSKFTSFKNSGLAMNYILVNLNQGALADINLRYAIAHALDRDTIIKFKLEGLASPASSLLTPGNPYFDTSLKSIEFSLDKAKAFLKKAKIVPASLSIKTSNKPSAVENAKILANQIAKLGIKVKIESYEWGTFFDDVKKGNYELATMRWVGATDPDIYRIAFHSSEHPPGRNRGYFSNNKLDQLTDKGRSILKEATRIQNYRQVQQIVAEQLPIIPLWYNDQVNIVSKVVKGFKVSKTGDFSHFHALSKPKN